MVYKTVKNTGTGCRMSIWVTPIKVMDRAIPFQAYPDEKIWHYWYIATHGTMLNVISVLKWYLWKLDRIEPLR